ncbi:MAG: gamma-glutamylcyclotransferase family protein [Bradymonadaceae bacterium]
MAHFFVYGTLRPGGHYWPTVADLVESTRPAFIEAFEMWHLPEGYPAIIAGRGKIVGDILSVAPENTELAMSILDEVEDCLPGSLNPLYERILVDAHDHQGPVQAYTYVYHTAHHDYMRRNGRPVQGGDWRRFMMTRKVVEVEA